MKNSDILPKKGSPSEDVRSNAIMHTTNLWKLLFQLWNGLKTSVGALPCRMVFDLCFVNFLWTTFKKTPKRKKINQKLENKHTSGKNLLQSEHLSALDVIPEMDLDVNVYTSFLPPRRWLGTKTWDVILPRRLESDEFWTMLNQLWK